MRSRPSLHTAFQSERRLSSSSHFPYLSFGTRRQASPLLRFTLERLIEALMIQGNFASRPPTGGGYSDRARYFRSGLQPLGMNACLGWRYNSGLCRSSVGGRLNEPLPPEMASFVHCPSCAAAFVNFHSPVVAVGRKCKHIRHRGRDHHAEQRSNQK